MTQVSGIGSWPGTSAGEALRTVRDLLGALDDDGVRGLPYLPELPARGPGGDLVGRGAGLLVDLPVDVQPAGWRLIERPGRDAARTRAFWRQDLDELAEAFDGYAGPFKVQSAGPWTLAATLWLARGERAIVDEGARRDIVDSLAEGVGRLLDDLQRLLPEAAVVLQLDEPALPAVLEGRLATASGLGRLAALEPSVASDGLRTVLAEAGARHTLVHCCAASVPIPLLRACGANGLSVDTALLTPRGWEGLAVAVEDGLTVYAGCVPTAVEVGDSAEALAQALAESWQRLGMPQQTLAGLTVTPACGLAGLGVDAAADRQRLVVEVARHLRDRAGG
ncbi:MAG: methionine synthase [Dermatophilaceae bacterium]